MANKWVKCLRWICTSCQAGILVMYAAIRCNRSKKLTGTGNMLLVFFPVAERITVSFFAPPKPSDQNIGLRERPEQSND